MLRRARAWLTSRPAPVRAAIGLVAFACIGFGGYSLWASFSTDRRVKEAQAAMDRRDFTAAVALLEKAQKDRPDSAQFAYLSARAHRRAGDLKAASQSLRRAKELGWSDEGVNFERNLLDAQTFAFRRHEPSLLEYARAEPPKPDAELAVDVLVKGYLTEYELGRVLELMALWTRRRPADIQYYLWQHEAASRLGSKTTSLDALKAAHDAAPENAEVRGKLGMLLADLNQAAEAKAHFEWLLERHPKDRSYRLGLARCQRQLGESDAAARALDWLLADDPKDTVALAERGYVESSAARPDAALPWLEKAVARDPYQVELLGTYANCLDQLGKSTEAKAVREKRKRAEDDLRELQETSTAIFTDPRSADLRYKAGEILARNGQEGEAMRWLESAARLDPQHLPTRRLMVELVARRLAPKPSATP